MSLTALVYVFIFFLGSLTALRGRPLIGMLVYLLTFYFHAPRSWWGSSLPDLRWSLLSSLITIFAVKIKDSKLGSSTSSDANSSFKKTGFFDMPEHTLYLLFVLWIWLQSFWALSPYYHNDFAVMASKFFLLLYLMHKSLVDEKSIVVFLVANLVGCGYFGWLGLSHQRGRFESVPTPGLEDGNLLSLHMVPILLFSCFILLCELTKKKYLTVIPIALTLNAIFLTQSRGAIVGMAVGGLLAFAFKPYRLRKQIYFYVLIAAMAVINLASQDLMDRLSDAAAKEDEGRDESAQSRIVIIKAQWKMFQNSPILGYGHRGTLMLSSDYIDAAYLTTVGGEGGRGSHNLLMSLLVDFGFIGASFYLAIIFIHFRRLFFMRKRLLRMEHGNLSILYIAGTSAFLALFVTSMFSNSLRLEIDILVFGMLTAIFCLIKDKQALPNLKPSGDK